VWTCEHCGETVDEDDFDVCWRCSSLRGRPEAEEPHPAPVDEPADDDRVAVFLALARGIRTSVAHPIILVAAVPGLLWHLAATVFGPSAAGFFVHPTSLDWRMSLAILPDALVFGPVSTGLATLLVYAAATGSVSVAQAASTLVRRFPALLATWVLAVPVMLVGTLPVPPLVALFSVYLGLYVGVRLTFWTSTILVDDLGPLAGARRAWVLAHGNWWRLCALFLIPWIVSRAASRLIPVPAVFLVSLLVAPVRDAIVTSGYLQRVGVLPGPSPFPSTLARRGAVAFPGS
jgi:hypothetical protein